MSFSVKLASMAPLPYRDCPLLQMTNSSTTISRDRSCPICAKDSSQVWLESRVNFEALDSFAFASRKQPDFMHFRLMRCDSCDVLYVHPAPSLDWVHNEYRNAAFDASTESEYAARTYRLELERVASQLPRRNSALDIGAGDGAFVLELLKAGFARSTGIEPSLEPVRRARPEVRELLRNEFFQSDSCPPGSLDLATCFQILEHVESPLDLCRSVHEMLVPGGALLIVAHDYRALTARILGERSPIYDIEHLQLFSAHSLRLLLEKAGFLRVEVRALRNTYPINYWLRLMPLPKALKQFLAQRLENSRLGSLSLSARVGNLVAVGFRP